MPSRAELRDRELKQKDWVSHLVAEAQNKKWYGKLTLIMEDGVLRRVVKEESIKPPA